MLRIAGGRALELQAECGQGFIEIGAFVDMLRFAYEFATRPEARGLPQFFSFAVTSAT